MSEQRQDTTTGQSTSGTVHQPSENASNTSKTAPKTAEEIHKLPSEELVDLLRRTYIECRDEEMTGDEYGVDLNHPSYATFLLAQTEMQNRKTLRDLSKLQGSSPESTGGYKWKLSERSDGARLRKRRK